MTFKILMISFSVIFSLSSSAANNVTCAMTSLKNKSIVATLPLSAVNGNEVESSRQGLTVGRENHSFMMGLTKENSFYRVDVIFFENNNVMDEVGNLSCKFKPTAAQKIICREPVLSDSGKLIANFACFTN